MAVLHHRLRSPATRLEFLRATWLTTSGSSLVVATRFYPGARKTFRSSWQAFRLQLRASIASANRSAFTLSQSLATPFADPFAGLKSRNLRDTDAYTENDFFDQLFVCFIFQRVIYSSCRSENGACFSRILTGKIKRATG